MKWVSYDTSNLRGDLFGGITAGIVALPLALAFGVQSGLGAIAGLYGAIGLGIFAAIFGGTRTQVSGPTGPMTVVSSLVVLTAIENTGSLEKGFPTIITIFLIAGALLVVFGLCKLGTHIKYIPYPVVSGFMTGIGFIIIIFQIFPTLGLKSPSNIIGVFRELPIALANVNLDALILTGSTIAVIYTFPKITKLIPSSLAALLFVSGINAWVNLNVPLVGDIPNGFPKLHLTEWTLSGMEPGLIIKLALTLALLGAIDSLLTSIVADNVTKTKHDSNQELIGQGIGNMFAASIGGLPGAGATMRTVVNINAGGCTRLSGVVHGIVLLTILMGLGVYAARIPIPVLAGILITVGVGIIDYKGIRHIRHIPRADAVVMIIVLTLTVFVDLIQAVAAGMIMASVLFMKQMSDQVTRELRIYRLRDFKTDLPWDDETIPDYIADKIYVKHLDGPLFFGFAPAFQQITQNLPDVRVVIFRMKKVPHIDQTGLYAMEEVITSLESRGIAVVMTGLQAQPESMMKRIKLIPELIPEQYIFQHFKQCIEWLEDELLDREKEDMHQFFNALQKEREKLKLSLQYRV
jgi:SulP family sulfate permease